VDLVQYLHFIGGFFITLFRTIMFSFAAHHAQRVPAEALEDNGIKFDNVIKS
jgi:hypothetical protein